jgi:hypothetical protein
VSVWGWGDDDATARIGATERLRRVLERIRSGQPFPGKYGYGNRPLREEILQTFAGASEEPDAVVSRNSYGAQVLNASRLLFLDVDIGPASLGQWIARLFGAPSAEQNALAKLRDALRRYGRATFRIYRTASGLRALAVDRQFDPAGREAQDLMQATGTDAAFSRLCLAQRSFRARLTPKPWRCGVSLPPGRHPRLDVQMQQRFASWLRQYEDRSLRYATCRYIETVGDGSPGQNAKKLLELHDRATRCNEPLPLA